MILFGSETAVSYSPNNNLPEVTEYLVTNALDLMVVRGLSYRKAKLILTGMRADKLFELNVTV